MKIKPSLDILNSIKTKRIKIKRATLINIGIASWDFLTFGLLLFVFITRHTLFIIGYSRFWPSRIIKFNPDVINKYYDKSVSILDANKDKSSIRRIELMDVAIRNMEMKKTRSLVTIGGMAVGIGAIVFLVSLGYGLQNLVITRVARLDEMQQVDMSPQSGSKLSINEDVISTLTKMKEVAKALPLIGVVARINYNLSVSDMPAYGVTADYLKHSATKPVKGKIFASNHISITKTKVKGTTTQLPSGEFLDRIQSVEYSIYPDVWIPVYKTPQNKAILIGYTRRIPGKSIGVEYWGDWYERTPYWTQDAQGGKLGKWIHAQLPIWYRAVCSEVENRDCEGKKYLIIRDDDGKQSIKQGYIDEEFISAKTLNKDVSGVLGISQIYGTSSAQLNSSASPSSVFNLDIEALIASEAGKAETVVTKQVKLGKEAYREAIVNRAMLKVMGLSEDQAIGKKFKASFVIVGDKTAGKEKIESEPEDYVIVGVISDERSPFFYVPLIDLRTIGIDSFSQVKVVTVDKNLVPVVRKNIEAMGFETASVVDTVAQINSLFSSLRLILALLGTVALAVAALGMFNTLTVSLLERTHEVGLMKAMGMKSHEVQELFLTESMVMGFAGGILGLIIGFVAGKILSILLSIFSLARGVGYIDISSLPVLFVFVILGLSLFVGFATGIYPARRAKKISALDALRYE